MHGCDYVSLEPAPSGMAMPNIGPVKTSVRSSSKGLLDKCQRLQQSCTKCFSADSFEAGGRRALVSRADHR